MRKEVGPGNEWAAGAEELNKCKVEGRSKK